MAWVDQGYTGDEPTEEAAVCGIELAVVRLPGATKGFILLARRWVVARSVAWATRFRRLATDDERLPDTGAGVHCVACACLLRHTLLLPTLTRP